MLIDRLLSHFNEKLIRMSTSNDNTMNSPFKDPKVHITTHDISGKAMIHSSYESHGIQYPLQKAVVNLLYTTSNIPADLNDEVDIQMHQKLASSGTLGLVNPNGTVCRTVDFAPGNTGMMHHTQSLDYGIVLEGSLLLELDDGSSTLIARGDIAIQRATMHAWKNASQNEWARILFVLQDCSPVVVGGQALKEDLGSWS